MRFTPSRGEDGSVNEVDNAEVREALHEFHQYLSDQLAPLLVGDAMSVLLTCSPALMGSAIQSWLWFGTIATSPVAGGLGTGVGGDLGGGGRLDAP